MTESTLAFEPFTAVRERSAAARRPSPRKPRRVLFLDHTAVPSGGELALLNLVSRLDPRRYIPVVVLFTDGPLREKLNLVGIETHVLHLAPGIRQARKDDLGIPTFRMAVQCLKVLRFTRRLSRFIRQQSPDLVHCNSLKSDLLGGIASRMAGVPVVWHIRDRIADDYLPRRVASIFRWLCHWIPNCVVANSHATMKTLAIRNGATPARAHVIHGGVKVDGNAPGGNASTHGATGAVLNRVAAPGGHWDDSGDHRPLVGLVGRIARWKGQHVFLQAVARVVKRFPDARFQIIGCPLFGESGYEAEVRELARTLDVTQYVEFTGFRADVREMIARLDILVHASIAGEPFGQVIIEGMAAGKPVVATEGGGVPEIIIDGETGLLVPMGNVDAMAAAIESLLGDPLRARAMGHRGWQHARDRFTLEIVAENVQAAFDRLLDQTSTGVRTSATPNIDLQNDTARFETSEEVSAVAVGGRPGRGRMRTCGPAKLHFCDQESMT